MPAIDTAALKRSYPLTWVARRRYGIALRPSGPRRLTAHCPLPGHAHDRAPSFTVYAEQDSFFCFGCGRGGDVITLIELMEGLGFRAAVERLTDAPPPAAGRRASPAPRPRSDAGSDQAARDALAQAVDIYARHLRADARAMAYLHGRGLSRATIVDRRLGLAGGLPDELARRRVPRAPYLRAGLLRPNGRERLAGRVTIPELVDGRPTWLTGRLLPGSAPEPAGRYESLPGPRPLLGLGGLPPDAPQVLVTEGAFDALLLGEWGLPAVALGGTTCSPAMLAALARLPRVVLLLDRDPAGARAATALAATLGARAVVATLPDGVKDAADLAARPDGRRRLAATLAAVGASA